MKHIKAIALLLVFLILACAKEHTKDDVLVIMRFQDSTQFAAILTFEDSLRADLSSKSLGEIVLRTYDKDSNQVDFSMETFTQERLYKEIRRLSLSNPSMGGTRVDVFFGLPQSDGRRKEHYIVGE